MSKTSAAIHAPMGTVTRIGWNGWPYGPAATVTGSLASSTRAATSDRARVVVVAMGEHLLAISRGMYPQSADVTLHDVSRGHQALLLLRRALVVALLAGRPPD